MIKSRVNQAYIHILPAVLCILLTLLLLPLPAAAEVYSVKSTQNVSVEVGAQKDLSGYILYQTNQEEIEDWYTASEVTWTSSDPDIASITGKGVVTGHRIGTVRITASSWDNTSDKRVQTLIVGVVAASEGSTPGNSFTLTDGKRISLDALLHTGNSSAVTWSSSNSSIASVDQSGLVTTHSLGRCTITATHTTASGAVIRQKVAIQVVSDLLTNRSNPVSITLKSGESVDTVKLFYPAYADNANIVRNISTTTGNSQIVDATGNRITAKSPGSCFVTIRYGDEHDPDESQKITVYVTD